MNSSSTGPTSVPTLRKRLFYLTLICILFLLSIGISIYLTVSSRLGSAELSVRQILVIVLTQSHVMRIAYAFVGGLAILFLLSVVLGVLKRK